jgi:hypothetical protein
MLGRSACLVTNSSENSMTRLSSSSLSSLVSEGPNCMSLRISSFLLGSKDSSYRYAIQLVTTCGNVSTGYSFASESQGSSSLLVVVLSSVVQDEES